MENNGSLGNGKTHEQPSTSSSSSFFRSEKSKKEDQPPEISAPEEKNWLLHRYYTRHEFELCKTLIERELKNWGGLIEYPHYLMGLILRREGKVQDSLDSFKRSYELNRHNVNNVMQIAKSLDPILNEEYLKIVFPSDLTRFLLGDTKQAIEKYLQAQEMADPPEWEIHYFLGECYIRENQLEEARKCLIRATELTKNEHPYMKLVKAYVMEGRIIEAIEVYKKAVASIPEREEIAIELGLMYLELGDTKRAFHQFGTVLAESPDNAKATVSLAYVMQSHGEYEVAYNKYKIAAQSMPESWALWNNIGMCLYGKQKYVSAITCLKRAHYLNPLAMEPACNLGLVFLATGQAASAAIHLCSAIASEPKSPMAYLLLGLALRRLDDLDGAEQSLEKAHSLAPQDPQVLINYAVILDAQRKSERARDLLVVLRDIAALIKVDDQIANMVKELAAKLQINDNSSHSPANEEVRTLTDDEV